MCVQLYLRFLLTATGSWGWSPHGSSSSRCYWRQICLQQCWRKVRLHRPRARWWLRNPSLFRSWRYVVPLDCQVLVHFNTVFHEQQRGVRYNHTLQFKWFSPAARYSAIARMRLHVPSLLVYRHQSAAHVWGYDWLVLTLYLLQFLHVLHALLLWFSFNTHPFSLLFSAESPVHSEPEWAIQAVWNARVEPSEGKWSDILETQHLPVLQVPVYGH